MPAIDPVSPKNRPITDIQVAAILHGIGLSPAGDEPGDSLGTELGRSAGWLAALATVDQRAALPAGVPVVLQVSRWDTLKDMAGVLTAFIGTIAPGCAAHLVLVGPDPLSIADDPGGVSVLAGIRATVSGLPAQLAERIHLLWTAGDDLEGTALVINALQRRATVITQKSIKEGFGLTITEGMLKNRPVVAPAVGAIGEQVIDERTGLLIDDPRDLVGFGHAVRRLLDDDQLSQRIARDGFEHCSRRFLIDRQLTEYARFYTELITRQLVGDERHGQPADG